MISRPAGRLFLLLVAAAVPPVLVAAGLLLKPDWARQFGNGTVLLIAVLAGFAWAAIVTVVGARLLAGDLRDMLEVAERGESTTSGGAVERLAAMLDERNRQIGELATTLRNAPIQADIRELVRSIVHTAISVTGDPTWTMAVLRSPRDEALPQGIYRSETSLADPISEVATWGATMDADDEITPGVRHGIGPWGAFVAVEVAAGDELRAALLAPWEGRPPPSRAERELLSLLGQNAAIALEHAFLVDQLRSQTDELNRMASVQSDFLRGVTHDLQTPLASIRAVAAELSQQPGLGEASRGDLETIGHQADRLRRMVAQLLAASRLEAGALEPVTEIFRVEPLIERTWNALRAGRPLGVRVDGPTFLVVADPDRLEQVLWAVFDNAVKYSPDGSGVEVTLSLDRSAAADGRAVIAISDDGAGMDAESLRRAFEQFYRAPDARRLAPDGSGVGLYAARGLVEAMGGTITLESRHGSWTRVTIALPAESAAEESAVTS